jgi:hypothetical protein
MIPNGVENKLLVVDDILKPALLKRVKEEIRNIPRGEWDLNDHNTDYVKYRVNDEYIYGEKTEISRIIHDALFSKRVTDMMKDINDWAFKMIDETSYDIVYVTSHIDGKPCGWHKNDYAIRDNIIMSLNYIFHIDIGSEFTGGELEHSYDNIDADTCGWYPLSQPTIHQTVHYKDNRVVILPTYSWHKVNTIKTPNKIKEPLDGRITINGHIGFRLNKQ